MSAGRWPLADLVERLAPKMSASQVRHSIARVSGATWNDWMASGRCFDDIEADRLAIRAGLHPCQVWPAWFDDVPCEQLELFDLLAS